MSGRVLGCVLLGGLGYAALVTAGGGGVDDPNSTVLASADGQHVNPNAGRLFGRCVVLQGDGWADTSCDTPAAIPAETNPEPGGGTGDMGAEGYGTTLTAGQIRGLWIRHGGDPAKADVAAAVARAESGGRPGATNRSNSNGSVDRGLFQINSIHGSASTYDLDANVAYAVQLQREQGWSPWVAYTSKAYVKYLGATT